ncbi:MAG: STAS domain-containing protein [Nitrospirota bacterium]|nr:STAS domain-containing protein [Nitrospirota bacterium]
MQAGISDETHLKKVATKLAEAFELGNVRNPARLQFLETLYGVRGQGAVREHPQFHALIEKLRDLLFEFFSVDEPDIARIAEGQARAHYRAHVLTATFLEGAFEIMELARAEVSESLFRRFQRNLQRLTVETSLRYDAILQEARDELSKTKAMLEETLEAQNETIKELSTPVIPVWSRVLMVPMLGGYDSMRMHDLSERLLAAVAAQKPRAVLLDLSGLAHVDTQVASEVIRLIQALRLLGAKTFLCGIKPQLSRTLTGLGVDLKDVPTFATLEQALKAAIG